MTDHPQITSEDLANGAVFVSTEQLARRWQTSVKSIANRRADGRLKLRAHRLGTALRYKMTDVLAYEQASVIADDAGGDHDE